MKHIALVLVFFCGLVLKASLVAGVEAEKSGSTTRDLASAAAASAAASSSGNDGRVDNIQQPEQRTNIQNNNNITVGSPGTTIGGQVQNPVGPTNTGPVVAYQPYSYDEPAGVIIAKDNRVERRHQELALIPMVGGSLYATRWGNHINNSYTFGLGLEIPLSWLFAAEIEGGMARYNISYGNGSGFIYRHSFSQFNLGSNLKVYLFKGVVRPYLAGGLMALYYDGMSHGPTFPDRYSTVIGAGQLVGGTDIALSEDVAIGGRAAWVVPLFNRPYTVDNGLFSAPRYEEAGAINTSFYKLMATLRVSF